MTTVTLDNFVQTVRSNVPSQVVLSVPHDGLWGHNFAGHFTPRSNGVILADRHVTPIANDILLHCNAKGLPTSIVRFLMPRTYVDANRPAPNTPKSSQYDAAAYADEAVKPYYEHYFGQLGELITDGTDCHGSENVLVLDLHGFTKGRRYGRYTDYDVILGTDYRKTIRYGDPDIRFGRHLNQAGIDTFVPSNADTLPGGDPFPGGYISEHISETYGVNVVQVEMEKRFREKDADQAGRQLALTIGEWLTTYLL